ncbi:pentapeptide repeat-containing protein [Phaeobacter marinintestinus]|uniref:pentapeptide repeat-containing protein n=1 Tax=Falsiphaeobacter marinintestinus TaxID=1492905 RepID=UPI0011B4BC4F|nr:pentapeptide repeat-containing protein [Phaeobacter marinintestinus]
MSDNPQVTRINALTQNARSTWFVLFSILIFSGVTLVRVEHIDFYGVDRQTHLPVINIGVPTWLFFYAQPILVAAIYCYFHLYLIRLWEALGQAPTRIQGTKLADSIMPWLVTDAALHLRRILRRDNCCTLRDMEGASMTLNFLLAWSSGPFILGWTWCKSMAARDFAMTLSSGILFSVSVIVGAVSLVLLFRNMKHPKIARTHAVTRHPIFLTTWVFMFIGCIGVSWARTTEPVWIVDLATIDLREASVTNRPSGWLPPHVAKALDYRDWCTRDDRPGCFGVSAAEQRDFDLDWYEKRRSLIADIRKPARRGNNRTEDVQAHIETVVNKGPLWSIDVHEAETVQRLEDSLKQISSSALDFRKADLRGAFLADANLVAARFASTHAPFAVFEHADLSFSSHNKNTNLHGAQLSGAILRWSRFRGSDLSNAHLDRADLRGAKLVAVNLLGASMVNTVFANTELTGSKLDLSYMAGSENNPLDLGGVDLSSSTNEGGALRHVDLYGAIFDDNTDWRNVFLDGSVEVPLELERSMNFPCQWEWARNHYSKLLQTEQLFFSQWRGWLSRLPDWQPSYWSDIAPKEWHDVQPVYPPEHCLWKTNSEQLPSRKSLLTTSREMKRQTR